MTKSIWAFKVSNKVKVFVSKDLANYHSEKLKNKPRLVEIKLSNEQFISFISSMDNKNHSQYTEYISYINSIVSKA